MKAITFPFKKPGDEVAFHAMLTMLSPEDRDTMIEMHNRRDPKTGYLRQEDLETNSRLTAKLVHRAITEGLTDEMKAFGQRHEDDE